MTLVYGCYSLRSKDSLDVFIRFSDDAQGLGFIKIIAVTGHSSVSVAVRRRLCFLTRRAVIV